MIETIETCFRRAGITIAKLTLSTTDLGNVIPTEQERNSGCIFVDMGSQTTTVAVYKSRLLRHLAVIPLGSDNITQDIVKVFNCDENRAEELKRTYGYPDFQNLDDSEENHIVLEGGRKYSQKSLAEIIEARVEEIIQNVAEQAKRANISFDKLVNGVIVTGGAAQLRNISKAFEQHFKDLNLIETGEIDCNGGERIIPQEPTLFTEEHSQAAETNAEIPVVAPAIEEPAEPETPKPAKENIFKRVGKYLSSLVSDNE